MLADKIDPTEAPPEFKLKDLIAQSEDTGNTVHKFGEPMKRKNNIKKKIKETSEISRVNGDDNETDANVNGNDSDGMSRFD